MNEETAREIERELKERKEKMSMLQWAEFLQELPQKLEEEELDKLFSGIDRIKLESRIEGYNKGLDKAKELLNKRVEVMDTLLEKGRLADGSKLSDGSYSFSLKLKENLTNTINFIEKEKIKSNGGR